MRAEPASAPGTYLLLLECNQAKQLKVGSFGNIITARGYYLYAGSAFGPGGVKARVGHHSRVAQRPHWHIDYLRSVSRFLTAWCRYDERLEHQWAQALSRCDGMDAPFRGFGSSDCGCATHLFFSQRRPLQTTLERVLNTGLDEVGPAGW